MLIPGNNILNMAFNAIAKSSFQYVAFQSNALNDIGYKVPVYAAPVTVTGSAQPMPRRLYEQYGLDLQKTYWNFFIEQSVMDIERDVSSDQFILQGAIYQCISAVPWYGIDGWLEVLTVLVPS